MSDQIQTITDKKLDSCLLQHFLDYINIQNPCGGAIDSDFLRYHGMLNRRNVGQF